MEKMKLEAINYSETCRPMHFTNRAKNVLTKFSKKDDAIKFVQHIVDYVEKDKSDFYKNKFLYWTYVRESISA